MAMPMPMAETTLDSVHHPVPGTPGIREVRSDSGSESFGFPNAEPGRVCPGGIPSLSPSPSPTPSPSGPGIRRVGLRAEIDTSPPFGSVKEAVTRFGGSGPWIPYYKLGENYNGDEEFDIKRVEEQAAELEKDLIVKELETLDILEELSTNKRIVEELKRQLQQEAFKCLTTPELHPDNMSSTPQIKEMNQEHERASSFTNQDQRVVLGSLFQCPASSPDMILMELKQAKMNLGKTINDLGVIQTSVESLNKRMKKEKSLIEKTRERLTSKFAGAPPSLEEELKHARVKSPIPDHAAAGTNVGIQNSTSFMREIGQLNSNACRQLKKMGDAARAEVSRSMLGNEQSKTNVKTAEMRWFAAKKMEEAARAAEALAMAEIKALSGNESSSGFFLPEPVHSPLNSNIRKPEGLPKKKFVHGMHQLGEANISKLAIVRKLEEATEEVLHSKHALEEALNRVEIVNQKQIAVEEALRKWMLVNDHKGQPIYNAAKLNNFHESHNHPQHSPLNYVDKSSIVNDEPKPVLRPTVSMRDILSRKQILAEDFVNREQNEGQNVRQKVALSQMLNELKGDLTFHPKSAKDGGGGDHQKQFYTQRRKFGFIHISLPLTKQSKKKVQDQFKSQCEMMGE